MDKIIFPIESAFECDGFRCIVVFNGRLGMRCGYVAVPADHPLAGKKSDEISEVIEMHGGCSFAENGTGDYPEPGPHGWIGFDCAHARDAQDCDAWEKYFPEIYRYSKEHGLILRFDGSEVRTLHYCEEECRSIARQLAAIARSHSSLPKWCMSGNWVYIQAGGIGTGEFHKIATIGDWLKFDGSPITVPAEYAARNLLPAHIVPWTLETAPTVLKTKNGTWILLRDGYKNVESGECVSFEFLAENAEQFDGSPCGVPELMETAE